GRRRVPRASGAGVRAASVGAVLAGLVVLAVGRPLEAREARTRAELAASSIASTFAAAPEAPRGSELDTLLARERTRHALRPAVLVGRWAARTLQTSPPAIAPFVPRRPPGAQAP